MPTKRVFMYIQKLGWKYTQKTNQNVLLLANGHKCLNTRYKNPSEFSTVYQSDTQAAFSSNKRDCIHKASFRTHTKYTAGKHKSWAPGCQGDYIFYSGAQNLQLDCQFFLHTKHEYQRTCTEQKASDNSEDHRLLPNCGSSGWSVFLVTLRRCLESGGGLQISVKFTTQPFVNKPFT